MGRLKILMVEDDKEQQQIFSDSVDVYKDKHNCDVEFVFVESLEQANQKIDGSFDGVIMDLKLKDNEEGGNKVAKNILKSFFRIPIIFVTGFPDLVDKENLLVIHSRARADGNYEDDLNQFFQIYNTGLTKIMGGRGRIEQILNQVFLKNLLPQLEKWKAYGKSDSPRTEKALLRFTLNHLVQILDDDDDQCFPEEVYIYPPLSDGLKTGSIVKKKDNGNLYVVLSPACDLVIRRNGQIKTDHILLVEIDNSEQIIDSALNGITSINKKSKKLNSVFGNNHTDYFHWLPPTGFFDGGFLNFREIATSAVEDVESVYDKPHIQISPHFVKDILSRFSSYYARQGQPDIERNKIIEEISALSGEAE